jgi:hypothetical protein
MHFCNILLVEQGAGDPILVKMSAHLPESLETLKYAVLRRNKTIPTGFLEFPFFAHFDVLWI